MRVEGEWRWFTELRLVVARAMVWSCCKLMVWSLRLCLSRDHPMRVFYEGWFELEMPARLAALRRPASPRVELAQSTAHRALMLAAPTVVPFALLAPTSLFL